MRLGEAIRLTAMAAVVLLLCVTSVDAAPAEDPNGAVPDASASPLAFRRAYVPLGDLAEALHGRGVYLPLERSEFERLLERAQAAAAGLRESSIELREASYNARLVGDTLTGRGAWVVTHRNERAAALLLDPLQFAIERPAWKGKPPLAADLGIRHDGRAELAVPRDGTLEFDWSLRGRRTDSGAISFRLELPRATTGRVSVDLPAMLALSSDRGLVTPLGDVAAGLRRWNVELGGRRQVELRVAPEFVVGPGKPLALVRQAAIYEFSPRGLDVAWQLRLDVHRAPLARLELQVDSPLKLVAARYGQTDLNWTTLGKGTSPARVVIELPKPLFGGGHVIRLSAMAPPSTAARLRLPAIRAVDAVWQEGAASLVIARPLLLNDLLLEGCRQTSAAALPAPRSGESVDVQYFAPEGTIDLELGPAPSRLAVDQATQVDLAAGEALATSGLVVSATSGEQFQLAAMVATGWQIETVESPEPGTSVEWRVEDAKGKQRLLVGLARPVAVGSPLKLTVVGRRPLAAEEQLPIDAMHVVRFEQASIGRQLVAVRSADGGELTWSSAETLQRLDPAELAHGDAQLFVEPPSATVFAVDSGVHRAAVLQRRRKPQYEAEVRVDATLNGTQLIRTYTLRCLPREGWVERVLVQFNSSPGARRDWTMLDASTAQWTARRLTPQQTAAAGLVGSLETWEIALRTPRNAPFELHAGSSSPATGRTIVGLAAVPEATEQRGSVVLRAAGGAQMSIEAIGLAPVPAPTPLAGALQDVRAAFRYDPARGLGPGVTVLSVTPVLGSAKQPGAWAWQCRLDSQFGAGATAMHVASFHLSNAGRSTVTCQMPDGSDLLGAWLDETVLTGTSLKGQRQFKVELPPQREETRLSVYFSTRSPLPYLVRMASAPLPELDVPVLSRRWTLWLPGGYELSDVDPRWQSHALPGTSWRRRLFGPLGAAESGDRFSPFSASSWRSLLEPSASLEGSRDTLGRLLGGLTRAAAAIGDQRAPAATWGDLLAECQRRELAESLRLLVDRESLQLAGIGPDTPVAFPNIRQPAASTGAAPAVQMLADARLAVLLNGRIALLTSAAGLARSRAQAEPLEGEVAWHVLDGPLAHELETAARDGSEAFWSADAWRQEPSRPTSAPLGAPAADGAAPVGWHAYSLDVAGDGSPGVLIVRPGSTAALGWSLMLAVVALAAWKSLQWLPGWLGLAGVLAAAALLLPAGLTPLVAYPLLGTLSSLAWMLTARRVPRSDLSHGSGGSVRRAIAGGATLLLVAAALASLWDAAGCLAQQPTDGNQAAPQIAKPPRAVAKQPMPAPAGHHLVVVPIDERQVETGTYYLPEALYTELVREDAANELSDWVLQRASYDVALTGEGPRAARIVRLNAELSLNVRRTASNILAPLVRRFVGGTLLEARLDRRTVHLSAEPSSALAIESGTHRLELSFDVPIGAYESKAGFDLQIPAAPSAVARVRGGADLGEIDLPEARGQISVEAVSGVRRAALGPATKLAVRWSAPAAAVHAATLPVLDELLWVGIRPGVVKVDLKLKLHGGEARQILLHVDPRLQLVTPTGSGTPIESATAISDGRADLAINLATPLVDATTLDLSFVVAGASGVGSLRLPLLETIGTKVSRRYVAVSADPLLELSEQVTDDVKPLATPDFLAAWGATENRPQLARVVPAGQTDYAVAARPRRSSMTVDQRTSLSIGPDAWHVHYTATLATSAGSSFQLRLDAPLELEVDAARLTDVEPPRSSAGEPVTPPEGSSADSGAQKVTRVARNAAGQIVVLLSGPINGRQQLQLDGRLPPAPLAAVPRIAVAGAEPTSRRLDIYRRETVLVELRDAVGFDPADSPTAADSRRALGRLLGSYTLTRADATASIATSPNVPRIAAVQVLRLRRDARQWIAEMELAVNPTGGLVDAVRLDVPAEWTDLAADKQLGVELLAVPGQSRRTLVLRPPAPIREALRCKVRGRISVTAGQRLHAPDARLLGAESLQRYVVLPTRHEGKQLQWNTSGLRPGRLPAEWKASDADGSALVMSVVAERCEATLEATQRATAAPRVKLADVHVAWHSDGSCFGAASFDLEPGAGDDCTLHVPPGYRVVHARVEGQTAQLMPRGEHTWQIALGAAQLPQRVELIYLGQLPAGSWDSAQCRLAAPQLLGAHVERALWTVYSPSLAGAGHLAQAHSVVSLARYELHRLDAWESLLEDTEPLGGQWTAEAHAGALGPWHQRLLSAERNARRYGGPSYGAKSDAATIDEELHVHHERQEALRQKLSDAAAELTAAGTPGDASADPLDSGNGSHAATRCAMRGAAPLLALSYPATPGGGFGWRLMAALGTLAAAALAGRRAVRGRIGPFPPHLTGLAVGLAWWLWMVPSVAGLVLFGLSAGVAARNGWHRLAPRPEAPSSGAVPHGA